MSYLLMACQDALVGPDYSCVAASQQALSQFCSAALRMMSLTAPSTTGMVVVHPRLPL